MGGREQGKGAMPTTKEGQGRPGSGKKTCLTRKEGIGGGGGRPGGRDREAWKRGKGVFECNAVLKKKKMGN